MRRVWKFWEPVLVKTDLYIYKSNKLFNFIDLFVIAGECEYKWISGNVYDGI